ncbi:hypothetical protein F2Q70_00042573 [Brassica cretica]|uniref:HIT-type domain-containing protein n=1 Tax=Brassica cretica TaxID=69181 RepID=A0A8S9KKS1_BRACR|nr:hypothetical protein F2Q70_00042573 [Brassica cretica]
MDNSSVCGECKLKPWKYKCPGCSIRSCGLPCAKAHKQRTGCTGKRKVTDFVTLSHFDDSLLLSDYRMLEETKRVAESAKRMRNQICKNPYFKESQRTKLRAAAARGNQSLQVIYRAIDITTASSTSKMWPSELFNTIFLEVDIVRSL